MNDIIFFCPPNLDCLVNAVSIVLSDISGHHKHLCSLQDSPGTFSTMLKLSIWLRLITVIHLALNSHLEATKLWNVFLN